MVRHDNRISVEAAVVTHSVSPKRPAGNGGPSLFDHSSGCSAGWQRVPFGAGRSAVQIRPAGPTSITRHLTAVQPLTVKARSIAGPRESFSAATQCVLGRGQEADELPVDSQIPLKRILHPHAMTSVARSPQNSSEPTPCNKLEAHDKLSGSQVRPRVKLLPAWLPVFTVGMLNYVRG
jgi:hypothetical protein